MKYIAVFVEVSIQGVRCMTLCKLHTGLNQCKRDHLTSQRYKLKPPDWFCNQLSACLCSTLYSMGVNNNLCVWNR